MDRQTRKVWMRKSGLVPGDGNQRRTLAVQAQIRNAVRISILPILVRDTDVTHSDCESKSPVPSNQILPFQSRLAT